MGNDPPFPRTTCACAADRENCRFQPGYLIPRDLPRIAGHLGITVAELGQRHLWASPGALIMDPCTRQMRRAGTITPRMEEGKCVFLSKQEQCTIHPVAPFGCAYFDVHMPPHEDRPRSVWGIAETLASPLYRIIRWSLRPATWWRGKPVEETLKELRDL
jgi:Fe-S-cluster containining protein